MLTKGDKAPDFSGIDQFGHKISLDSFTGKKVVLYFYPKDNTPGCTNQACNLRDNYNALLEKGYAVIGISPDDQKSHEKFSAKYSLPFPLIADPQRLIIDAYGVWGLKKMYGKEYEGLYRTTFILDENGIIESVIDKVKTDDHSAQIFNLHTI